MDNLTKKELATQYKEREITGAIYVVQNKINNKMLLQSTTDIQGSKNRFEFSQNTDSCVYPKLKNDWKEYGCSVFELKILETLNKGKTQSIAEFKKDIEILLEMWVEKLSNEALY